MSFIGSIFRLLRALWVLARHDALLPKEYQSRMPWPARWLGRVARIVAVGQRSGNPGERFARALEKLGPAYIKLGQFLGTRSDMLDPDFARGLARLKDNVPPFSLEEAEAAITQEFQRPWSELFKSLGEPVAAASVAQVHKAVEVDGTVSAVKILRPGIEQQVAKDIKAFRLGAKLAETFVPASRRLEPRQFIETMARSLTLELDLRLEAAAAGELDEAAFETDLFRVPEVDWSRTGKRIMTSSWIDGTSLAREEVLGELDGPEMARTVLETFLVTALNYGAFHADMHEGNMLVDKDGQLVLVDFGIIGRLGPAEQRYLAEILYGFIERDYHRVAQVHFDAGYVPDHHSVHDFAGALRAVGEPVFGKRAEEVAMSRLLLQLFDITDLFDMHLRPELVLLQKTMVQVEGVGRRLDPRMDTWEIARPIVADFMRRELGPQTRIREAFTDLNRLQATLRKLPGATEDVAALARAWRAGEVDLSTGPMPPPAKSRPWLWAIGGSALTLAALYVGSVLG